MPADPPRHLLDTTEIDPTGVPPLCDEATFAELIRQMVANEAPRLFAIVQEYGERVDAEIAGWGLWFGDRAVTFDVEGTTMSMRSVESAMRLFRSRPHVTPRLCWAGPEQAQHGESPLRQHDE